jgi:hypothetical protein
MSTDDTTIFGALTEPEAAPIGDALPRPRTRWAAIVWGAVFMALAAAGIGLASAPERLDDVAVWLLQVEPGAAVAYGLLAVGGLVLVIGLAGLLRRAQRARSTSAHSSV